MELKSGYKQTEVGVIPEDWLTLTYGKVFDFLKTATYSRAEVKSTDGVLYVHYGDIHTEWDGFVDFNTANVCCVTDEQAKAYSLLKNGDLIMADASEDYGGIGKSVEVKNLDDRKAISGLHTFVLRDSENIIADGYRGYLHSNKQIKKQFDRLATGMKVFGVSRNNLKTVLIPLPPTKAEQEAIAEALSDADALIASLEQLIAKKRLIKQGAMQELLTGKRRLPGFSGDWEEKTLGDVVETDPENLGANTPADYRFNYVSLEDVQLGYLASFTEQDFATAPSRARRKIKHDDILMSTVRPNLKAHLHFQSHDSDWICSTGFCVLRCRDGLCSPSYVFAHLFARAINKQIDALLTGSNYPAINSKDVRGLSLLIPSVEEQTAIATVLSEMDEEIDALETKLSKARLLKQGMMQELLTGRIRLV